MIQMILFLFLQMTNVFCMMHSTQETNLVEWMVKLMIQYDHQPLELSEHMLNLKRVSSHISDESFQELSRTAKAKMLHRKILQSPLDNHVKIWQSQRQELLSTIVKYQSLLKQDQEWFESRLLLQLRKKIDQYLNHCDLLADPIRAGIAFENWLIMIHMDFKIFKEEIQLVLADVIRSLWTIEAAKAAQIQLYLRHQKKQAVFHSAWRHFELSKILSLKKGLSPPNDVSRVPIILDNTVFLLEEEVDGDDAFRIFKATNYASPNQPLMFSILMNEKGRERFINECDCLAIFNRLMYYSDRGIYVEKVVNGISLESFLPSISDDQQMLAEVSEIYARLNRWFYRKTGLIHHSITPKSVIIDPETGNFEIIQLDKTSKVSEWESEEILSRLEQTSLMELQFLMIDNADSLDSLLE